MDVPIIQALYSFYSLFHEISIKFPKSQRHSLGNLIQTETLDSLKNVISAAGNNQKELKLRYLREASTEIDLLRLLIRLSKDCKCVSNKQYLDLETKLHEIGKMLGGWIKSV